MIAAFDRHLAADRHVGIGRVLFGARQLDRVAVVHGRPDRLRPYGAHDTQHQRGSALEYRHQ